MQFEQLSTLSSGTLVEEIDEAAVPRGGVFEPVRAYG